jgi:hypothetical protein
MMLALLRLNHLLMMLKVHLQQVHFYLAFFHHQLQLIDPQYLLIMPLSIFSLSIYMHLNDILQNE